MKKGFFFVITVFLILTYILTSISLWVKVTNEAEKQYSERLRSSNVQFLLQEVRVERMTELLDKTAFFSLFKLSEHAAQGHFLRDDPDDELLYFRKAMGELVLTGQANETNFADGTSLVINTQNFSLNNFVNKLNLSLSNVGMRVSNYSVGEFNITQESLSLFNYSLLFNLTIVDRSNSIKIERQYNITSEFSFEGFVDPLIYYEGSQTYDPPRSIEREYYFSPAYDEPSALSPSSTGDTGSDGQGWFYGPLVAADDASSIAPEDRFRHILVGTYDEIVVTLDGAEFTEFGAHIVTSEPRTFEVECELINTVEIQIDTLNPILQEDSDSCVTEIKTTNVGYTTSPFAVIDGFSVDSISADDANFACPDGRCVLFINQFSVDDVFDNPDRKLRGNAEVYGIEKLRDFALCGYFINNDAGPSYTQRLLEDGYDRDGSEFGIDTFLIGEYIYDINNPELDDRGKVDKEFFNNEESDKIRGMPGCKSPDVCADDTVPIGHFSLYDNYGQNYYTGTSEIACDDGRAGCE